MELIGRREEIKKQLIIKIKKLKKTELTLTTEVPLYPRFAIYGRNFDWPGTDLTRRA